MSIDSAIYNVAIKNKLSPEVAKFLVAQARYESTDYTSNVFKQNTNLFGYKYVGQSLATRGTLAPKSEWPSQNTPGYYAKYKNVEDSALEVIKWLFRRNAEGKINLTLIKTPGQYAAALKAGNYYGQSAAEYSNGLTAKLKKINLTDAGSNMASSLPIFLLIGLAFSLFRK